MSFKKLASFFVGGDEMFTNEIVEGIAKKIKTAFPDKKIELEAIPNNAVGKIFVTITETKNKNELGGVKKTEISFDISYWCKDSENIEYNDWIAKMYGLFDVIETASGNSYRAQNKNGQKGEGVYHFLFDLTFRYRTVDDNKMTALSQKGGMR